MRTKAPFTVALTLAVFSYGASSAQEGPASQSESPCHKISADLARLKCYDTETNYKSSAIEILDSKWLVRSDKSEMTDDTNVFASVESEDTIYCSFGGQERPRLMLRCSENTTSVLLATSGCHLTSSDYNDYGDVTYRLDDNPPRTQRFEESTSNRTLGLWTGGRSIPFIKGMFGHNSLLVRFTPYNQSPVEARFPIVGTEQAVAQLREACSW